MLSLKNYKNKKIGILGFGKSGIAAFNLLYKFNVKLYVYDDYISKPKNFEKVRWKHFKDWDWKNLYRVIISPGIKIEGKKIHECAVLAKKNKVTLINETNLLLEQMPKAKIFGITGTNGKSTLVSLISHILTENKIKNYIGGNYGTPGSLLSDPGKKGAIILELSSYQLLTTPNLKLDVATIINISPDHIDYHETFDNYISAKIKIIEYLKNEGILIINKNDKNLKKYINSTTKIKNKKISFIPKENNKLNLKSLPGKHNKILLQIACMFCKFMGLSLNEVKKSILNFKPLPHRMETVFNSKKFLVINDSKATNGESTSAAISSYKNIFWIAGGKAKEDGLGKARENLKNIRHIWLIANSRNFFEKQIREVNSKIKISKFETINEAIVSIFKHKEIHNKKKLTILFSPAAASFDQFKNFEQRGDFFKKTILNQLKKGF